MARADIQRDAGGAGYSECSIALASMRRSSVTSGGMGRDDDDGHQ